MAMNSKRFHVILTAIYRTAVIDCENEGKEINKATMTSREPDANGVWTKIVAYDRPESIYGLKVVSYEQHPSCSSINYTNQYKFDRSIEHIKNSIRRNQP